MLRQSLIRVRESDYMRTARSKGLSQRAALLRHGLRNALTSVVTIIGLQMGGAAQRHAHNRDDFLVARSRPAC